MKQTGFPWKPLEEKQKKTTQKFEQKFELKKKKKKDASEKVFFFFSFHYKYRKQVEILDDHMAKENPNA